MFTHGPYVKTVSISLLSSALMVLSVGRSIFWARMWIEETKGTLTGLVAKCITQKEINHAAETDCQQHKTCGLNHPVGNFLLSRNLKLEFLVRGIGQKIPDVTENRRSPE